jgi:GntR family transcriptional regulator
MPTRTARSVGGRIRLSGGSGTPVYIQLADQLKYLIGTGELGAGTRLPSARHLASNLQINRNTVLNAYAALAEDGYVAGRRGGGTVVCARSDAGVSDGNNHFSPDLLALVDQLVERAAIQGLTPDQMAAVVASHARMKAAAALLRVCFVECNPHSLEHYVGQIKREFDVVVIPVLLREIAVAAERGDFADADCVVSTFFHLSEVRRTLRGLGLELELLAIAVRPHLSTLDKLERLPRGSVVGVAYVGEDDFAAERLRRMTEAVQHVGLRHVQVQPFLLNEAPDPSVFAGLDALLVRPENIAAVRPAIPPGLATIEFLNEMDAASREFLREVFQDLRARRSGSRAAARDGGPLHAARPD